MIRWPISAEQARRMYTGGRGDATARRYARFWAIVFGSGLFPRRWVTLEVLGRRSHRIVRFPVGMVDRGGEWYLVSMLGEDCNWVRNVRAADGHATLWRRRRTGCRLLDVPVAERPPILKRYLDKAPGARPHFPVDRHADLEAFVEIAGRYPVFRVVAAPLPAANG